MCKLRSKVKAVLLSVFCLSLVFAAALPAVAADNFPVPPFPNQGQNQFGNQQPFDQQGQNPFGNQPPFGNQQPFDQQGQNPFGNQPPFGNQQPFDQQGQNPFGQQGQNQFGQQGQQPFGQQGQNPFGNQQPPFGNQQQPFGQQQQPFGNQQPPFGNQQPPFGNQQQPLGQQPSIDGVWEARMYNNTMIDPSKTSIIMTIQGGQYQLATNGQVQERGSFQIQGNMLVGQNNQGQFTNYFQLDQSGNVLIIANQGGTIGYMRKQ